MSELYQLPDGWEWKKLDKVTDVISGFAFKSSDFSSSNEIRSIKITNVGVNEFIPDEDNRLPISLTDKLSKYMVSTGDIVIALTRPYISNGLKVCFVPDSYNCAFINQRVAAIKSKNEVTLNKYIYYYLCTYDVLDSVIELSKTLNQPNLSIKDLEEFAVPLPPLTEQERIVQKLDALFERIDKAIALLQNNIDAADNFMNSVLNDVFSNLEQRYTSKTLDYFCNIISGYAFKSNDFSTANGVKSIKITNVGVRIFIEDDGDRLPFELLYKLSKFTVNKSDLVIALTRPYISNGLKVCFVPDSYDGAFINQRVAAIKSKHGDTDNKYVYYYLCTSKVLNNVIELSKTLNQPNLSIKDLARLELPLVPLSVQHDVISYLDDLNIQIEQAKSLQQQKMQNLLDLKSSILDQAFHGKL